jgi:hypothetical protein
MKAPSLPILSAVFSFCLTTATGQTFTTLESFETLESGTIENSIVQWNQARTEYSVYSGAANEFGQVTDGSKALEVRFTEPLNSWGQDFMVVLSPEASAKLRQAWESTDPHRWWIFYDLTFGSAGANWGNSPFWVGSPGNASYGDQVEVNGNWDQPVTGAIELGSIRSGAELVPYEGDRIALGFGFNADASEAGTVWVDNIRLLDTYAPGFKPTETVLEGFQDENFSILQPSAFEIFPYTRFDASDELVTEGTKSARIEISQSNWTTGATLDLNLINEVGDVLFAHPKEERLNYILSYDYKPVPDAGVTVSWFQLVTQGAGLGLTPEFAGGAGRTYSINLGTVDWTEPPILNLITQGGFEGYVDLYVDNVRLINTKGDGTAPAAAPRITGASASANSITLVFASEANAAYTVITANDPALPVSNWTPENPSVQSQGASTTWVGSRPASGTRFYRVRRNP